MIAQQGLRLGVRTKYGVEAEFQFGSVIFFFRSYVSLLDIVSVLADTIRQVDRPFVKQTCRPLGVARHGGKFNIPGTGWGVVLSLMPESRYSDKTVSRMSVGSRLKAICSGQAFHHFWYIRPERTHWQHSEDGHRCDFATRKKILVKRKSEIQNSVCYG